MGKCVEVISSGRDNGDLASNFPILRDYGTKMQPDVALFENSSALIMQMQREMEEEAEEMAKQARAEQRRLRSQTSFFSRPQDGAAAGAAGMGSSMLSSVAG